jgi:hypothetical protein
MKVSTSVLGDGSAATKRNVSSMAGRVRYCVTPNQEAGPVGGMICRAGHHKAERTPELVAAQLDRLLRRVRTSSSRPCFYATDSPS